MRSPSTHLDNISHLRCRPMVRRSRLIRLIDDPGQAPVTTIVAGAGFGKSVLAMQWAEQSSKRLCWIGLDPADNDPASFQAHLLDAAQSVAVGIPRPLHATSPFDELEYYVDILLAQTGVAGQDACLVLDNCEVLTDPQWRSLLNKAIVRLPANVFLVLVSRRSLPLKLSRLRSQGLVRDIAAADLRFTEREAIRLLEEQPDSGLTRDAMRERWALTGGWVAGLTLAGATATPPGAVGAAATQLDAWEQLLDAYVLEEIVDPLPDELREFSFRTAGLPFLTPALCDLVPGNENSEAVISRLVREFPIVTAIEGPGRRYEYAPPLAASLRRLAGSAGFGETPPAWQWRAAEWLVAEGELAAAAELALRAGDDDLIVHTFEALCRHLADRSDLDTMGGWLDRVAGATLGSSPSLSYWKIVSRLGLGQTVGMKDLVDEVEPYWLASGDSLQAGRAFLCRGMLAFFDGDLDEADRRLAEAWARLPEDALVERLYAATFRGKLAFRRGKDEPAAILLGEAVSCAMQLPVEEQWSWRVIAPDRGNAYALRGDLFSAITKYRLMLAELPATHRGLEGFLRCRLVTLAIERDDMDTANHEYEILERIGDGDRQAWHRQAVFARMRLLLAAGQRDEADAWGAAHLKDFRRLPEKNQLVLLLATIWLDRGELPMVRSWLRDIGTPAYPWVQEFGDISPHTLAIDLDLVEGNHGHAAVVAQELANEAAATKRWTEFIGLSVRSAIAHHELGELERDIEILRPAIRVGAKGGFVRTFDVRGYNILSMFSDLWSENREVLEVKGNLQRLQPSPPNDPSALITRREREVIQLVAQGLSNQQIADSMFISVNTVRNHLVRISRRLNARSRTEVVAKARRSGILV